MWFCFFGLSSSLKTYRFKSLIPDSGSGIPWIHGSSRIFPRGACESSEPFGHLGSWRVPPPAVESLGKSHRRLCCSFYAEFDHPRPQRAWVKAEYAGSSGGTLDSPASLL